MLAASHPRSASQDILVWLLIAVPFVGALIERAIGANLTTLQIIWIYGALNTGLILADAAMLKRSGQVERTPIGWFWLTPIYLFKRARALGRSLLHLRLWFVFAIASMLVGVPSLPDGNWDQYGLFGVPSCGSWFAQDQVKAIFPKIPKLQDGGVQVVETVGQTELSFADDVRRCRAIVRGSDSKTYGIIYSMQWKSGGTIRTEVRLAPETMAQGARAPIM